MSDPPSSPGPGPPSSHGFARQNGSGHIERHANRPEASRHGSDWLSRLHRRHDAKHHSSRGLREDEEAPLLAEADAYPTGEHARANDEADSEPRGRLGALKKAGRRSASSIAQASQTVIGATVNGTSVLASSTARAAKTGAQKTRKHSKKVMGTVIILLLVALAVLATMFGLHLATDEMNQTCTALSCIDAAANILQNLHPKAGAESSNVDSISTGAAAPNPCTDFDEFVCGGFSDHNDLGDDQGEIDAGAIIAAQAERLLRETAESPASKFSGADGSLHKLLKDHYTACMAEADIAKTGLEPLRSETEKIKDLMGKHDPVQPGHGPPVQVYTSAHEVGVNSLTDTMAYTAHSGVLALIDFHVGIDDKSPFKQAIFASPVPAFWAFGLSSLKQYQDMSIVAEYRNVAKEVLKNFFDEQVNTTQVLHLSPRNVPRLSANLDLAQLVIDFEIKLAMITPPKEVMMRPMKSYNKLNISAFEALLPEISLPRLVKALAPSDYTADSVIVPSPDYLSQLHFLLQLTKMEVLQAFFVWKTIQQHADRIEDPALKPLKDFNAKMKGSRVDEPPERWRQCTQDADEDLPWISAWFFLQDSNSDLKKPKADDITNNVRDAFSKILKKTKWLADEDGEQSADKVRAIKQETGSPKNMDASSLNSYYSDLTINEDTYFENKISASELKIQRQWAKLGKVKPADEWSVSPSSSEPHYDATLNRLLLPEALLHAPISYGSLPDYALFGSFGAISGHGLSQSVGPIGSYYDMNGTLSEQWSEASRAAFDEKAQCFIDQYSSYAVTGPDGSDYQVNGHLTLVENMADVVGANAAFAAWKEQEKKDHGLLLPGLEKYTRDQVFWLAFGNTLCSQTTKEMAVQRVRSSPRAPGRARILGTVANSKGFIETFKCSTKKPECELF